MHVNKCVEVFFGFCFHIKTCVVKFDTCIVYSIYHLFYTLPVSNLARHSLFFNKNTIIVVITGIQFCVVFYLLHHHIGIRMSVCL